MRNTKILITAALLTALTCISTLLIRVPTPGFGYIHPGDGFVLLCGLLLGPLFGAICAGIGSALSDLFAGYLIYIPATFVIKALCAVLIAFIASRIMAIAKNSRKYALPGIIAGGICAEAFMVFGYFLYESLMIGTEVGFAAALASVPFNLVQGAFGVILACVMYPVIVPLYRRALGQS